MSVTVMGQKLAMPVYCSPTALQRLYHHEGERAVAAAKPMMRPTPFGLSCSMKKNVKWSAPSLIVALARPERYTGRLTAG
jgi:isopentenyl diphosphate isomerase/L-lactate dehydrogenase-like FMN-dependent dehydrogenase